MSDLFVPYEIALIAKEKGFDELCFGVYYANTKDFPIELEIRDNNDLNSKFIRARADRLCIAPMYQQLINWFREKHEIEIYAIKQVEENEYGGIVGWCGVEEYSTKSCAPTYNEALDKALIEAFKLIK